MDNLIDDYTDDRPAILIVDRQKPSRELCAHALSDAGYSVRAVSSYEQCRDLYIEHASAGAVVLLGCIRIESDEVCLVERLVESGCQVFVMCALITLEALRLAFRAGAYHVEDKTYDARRVIALLEGARLTQQIAS